MSPLSYLLPGQCAKRLSEVVDLKFLLLRERLRAASYLFDDATLKGWTSAGFGTAQQTSHCQLFVRQDRTSRNLFQA